MIKKSYILTVVLALAATSALMLAYAAEDDEGEEVEQTVPYDSLPEAVRAAAEKYLGGAVISKAEPETDDDVTLYEIGATQDSGPISLKLTEDGYIVEIERAVSFSSLPDAVQQELQEEYPGQEFTEIEEVEVHYFEVNFVVDGKEREIKIQASGDIDDDDDR